MKNKNDIKTKYLDKIKARKDGRQFYVYIDRATQITATTYDSLIDKLYEMEYGRLRSTMADLYPEWLLWKRDYTSLSNKSLKEYTYDWKRFMENEEIVNISLADLKVKNFTNLFRKWTKDQKLTRKHFNNIKSLLNGIYNYAIENEIVERNPVKEVDCRQFTFKPVNNSDDVFSIKERQMLLDHLKDIDDIYSLAIQFDFHVVMRIGELLSLQWTDIEGDYIHVQSQRLTNYTMNDDLSFEPKEYINVNHVKGRTNDGFRYQPLTQKAKLILEEVRKINPEGKYIFMIEGHQLSGEKFNERLCKYCCEIGIQSRSSHKIRFTVASMLYASGMPLTSLQRLLGHTTVAMTMHYLRQVKPIEETSQIMSSALD
ncbi:MAG: tyrosine-type recombinase/integrase [Lachnospiraceae bacterium]|nr:tyrosine-type recombinase/integrase [Lachnospiraceae bacterium]